MKVFDVLMRLTWDEGRGCDDISTCQSPERKEAFDVFIVILGFRRAAIIL